MNRALVLALTLVAAPASAAPERGSDAILRSHLWGQLRGLPKGERPVVGLALSGGGVRGLAHVGVIQALEDAGFPVDVVAGTSMGAIVGAFYASGVGLDRMWDIPRRINLRSGTDLSRIRMVQLLLADSLLSSKRTEEFLRAELGERRFDQLLRPFACVAMDIRTGEKIIFREGPLGPAVRASMNLPGLFAPVHYRHRYLVDGGVVDYIPVDAARLLGAEWVLASVTEGDYSATNPTNVLLTLEQVIDIRGAILSRQQRQEADFVIAPEVGEVNFLEFERSPELVERGLREAKPEVRGAQEGLLLHALPRLLRNWGWK